MTGGLGKIYRPSKLLTCFGWAFTVRVGGGCNVANRHPSRSKSHVWIEALWVVYLSGFLGCAKIDDL